MSAEIIVPRLGWSMEEGTFAGWLKSHGETVTAGEPLFALESQGNNGGGIARQRHPADSGRRANKGRRLRSGRE